MSATTATGTPPSSEPSHDRSVRAGLLRNLSHQLGRYSLVAVFVAVVAGFSIANPGVFPTTQNAQTVVSTNAVIALLALAAMLPLAVGKFDISVGYQLGLAQGICSGLIINDHVPAAIAVVIVIGIGGCIGLINGFLVAVLRLDSFISTLGVGILVLAADEAYTNNLQITGTLPAKFGALGNNSVGGVPLAFIYVLIACALLWLLLEYTAWGRQVFATGGNERAAKLAGVNTVRTTLMCFVLTGLLCGAAGVLSVMMLGGSSPVVGLSSLLPAFAGAFLGATSIRPGRFNAIGTVLAIYLLAAGATGLQQLGAAFYVQDFFNGAALLLAVGISVVVARRRRGQPNKTT